MSSSGPSGSAGAGEGLLEEKVDLSVEANDKIIEAQQLMTSGGASNSLEAALAILFAMEKKCRTNNDAASLVKVCEASLQLCYDVQQFDDVVSTLEALATRRSQKSAAIKAMVTTCVPWCVDEPNYAPLEASSVTGGVDFRNKLVIALRDLSDGKLFLERERAVLTRVLATIKEQDGDVSGAADVLQEVHVETYGSLSKREKVEFILEQMRLTLAKKDYVRAAIVSSKISRKHLLEESMESYKVRFYTLMCEYHRSRKDALELAKDYHAIYSTPTVLKDDSVWPDALRSAVAFLALSPHGNEQMDMLNRIRLDPNLDKLDDCRKTIQLFLKKEVIPYPLPHQAALESTPALTEGGRDLAQHWQTVLHRRVVQHNLRVVGQYYTRIRGSRLAQLLQLSGDRLESELADMVSSGDLYAKIDRPNDIVRFRAPQRPEAILSDWSSDLDTLLHLVETTTHLIHKENMTSQ